MSRPSLKHHIRAAMALTHTTLDEITGSSRKRHLVRIRQAVWYAVYDEGNGLMSMNEIGRRMNRDHGSVSHGISEAREALQYNPTFRAFVANIKLVAQRIMLREQEEAGQALTDSTAQKD